MFGSTHAATGGFDAGHQRSVLSAARAGVVNFSIGNLSLHGDRKWSDLGQLQLLRSREDQASVAFVGLRADLVFVTFPTLRRVSGDEPWTVSSAPALRQIRRFIRSPGGGARRPLVHALAEAVKDNFARLQLLTAPDGARPAIRSLRAVASSDRCAGGGETPPAPPECRRIGITPLDRARPLTRSETPIGILRPAGKPRRAGLRDVFQPA